MKRSRLAAIAAVLLPLFSSGCKSGDIIDPVIEIPDKRVLVVVPFRDEQFDNGFNSPRGCELAERVTKLLKSKAEFKVRSQDVVISLYDDNNPTKLSARDVARLTKADYVLMGDVLKWRLKDDDMASPVYRGSCVMELSLYETADAAAERLKDDKDKDDVPANGHGRLAFAKRRVTASFPHEYGLSDVGTYAMSEEQIDGGLTNSAAQQVSWLFLAHTKDEEKLIQGK
jgi:hypothetical protein